MVLVSYDVATDTEGGKGRLRRLAKACRDYGQRVQYSVFEIEVEPAQWVSVKSRLLGIADITTDSLRFYFLGRNWQLKVEHHGAKATVNLSGPLIF